MERTAEVTIKGTKPYLFNRFIEADIEGGPKRVNQNTKDPEIKLYKTPDGKIYTPSSHLYGTLVDAAKNFQVRGKRRMTYRKVFGSSIDIEPDMILHKYQTWGVFSIAAVNPATKGRIMTHRPVLNEWEISFKVIFDDDDIPEDVLKEVLDEAGKHSGVGDWRPNMGGRFGKFMVTKFKV